MGSSPLESLIAPSDAVVALLRFCLSTNETVLFEESVAHHLKRYFLKVMESLLPLHSVTAKLEEAANGRSVLFELYNRLVVNYNESLYGHFLPTNLLVLLMIPQN